MSALDSSLLQFIAVLCALIFALGAFIGSMVWNELKKHNADLYHPERGLHGKVANHETRIHRLEKTHQ